MDSSKLSLFLPSLEGGGAERVFVELSKQFVALGCSVDLVLASAHGPYRNEVPADVRMIDLGASGVLASLPSLVRYLRTERPQVMLSGLDHANIIGLLACAISRTRTRCVISVRCVPTAMYREDRSVRGFSTLQLMKLLYRFADGIIGNSAAVAADLSRSFGVAPSRITTILNPIDVDRVTRESLIRLSHPWANAAGTPIILSVGSLTVVKDFLTLVRAFSIIRQRRDCRLVILGEGPERPPLERLIRDLGVQADVHLPGFVSNPFSWMKCAAVFVSSSLTEGCPNALMQALACGTAVVSTDCVGGSAEVLQGGKWGRLVPVRNPGAMAAGILATMDSASRPDVRQRASEFAIDRVARQYLECLIPGYLPAALVPGTPAGGMPGAEEGAAGCGLPALTAIRMPHTSQKSSLAES